MYGRFWFRSIESGFVILIVTFFELLIIAILGIVIPSGKTGKFAVSKKLYFLGLGFGFFFFEMYFIQKLTLLFGKAVYSSAFVIFILLTFAGMGSMFQKKIKWDTRKRIRLASVAICLNALLLLLIFSFFFQELLSIPFLLRFFVILILMTPFSFFLGWLFPSGLEILTGSEQIPTAWAINGFSSVLAGPLAMIMFVTFGLNSVFFLAVLIYFGCFCFSYIKGR